MSREARQGGEVLALTTREFDLLQFFLRHPHEVFSRDDLLKQVWGWEFGDHSTVTVHVKRLRHKIEARAGRPATPRHGLRTRLSLGSGDSPMSSADLHSIVIGLITSLGVVAVGAVILRQLRTRALATSIVLLTLVPLIAIIVGVVGTSQFMFTAELRRTAWSGSSSPPSACRARSCSAVRWPARSSGSARRWSASEAPSVLAASCSPGSATTCARRSPASRP